MGNPLEVHRRPLECTGLSDIDFRPVFPPLSCHISHDMTCTTCSLCIDCCIQILSVRKRKQEKPRDFWFVSKRNRCNCSWQIPQVQQNHNCATHPQRATYIFMPGGKNYNDQQHRLCSIQTMPLSKTLERSDWGKFQVFFKFFTL